MSSVLTIRGGVPLTGRVTVRGAKNLVPKAMVAALLGSEPSVLRNVPEIKDVEVVTSLLQLHGVTVVKDPAVYEHMNMAGLNPDGRLVRRSMEIELGYFRERGYYTGSLTLDDVIDASFAEYAAQQLGPYQ